MLKIQSRFECFTCAVSDCITLFLSANICLGSIIRVISVKDLPKAPCTFRCLSVARVVVPRVVPNLRLVKPFQGLDRALSIFV